MKNERVGWKEMGKLAAAVALGIGASAQTTGGGNQAVIKGRPVIQGSLEDDIHAPQFSGRKIVLHRDEERELQIAMRMRPHAGLDPLALVPSMEEMDKTLTLSGGMPGGVAVIHLDTRLVVRGGGGARIVGAFDGDGVYEVDLPADLPLRGLFAYGEEVLDWDLVLVPAAGSARRMDRTPSTDTMDLDLASRQAYASWVFYWTDLQLRAGARMRGASIEAEDSTLLAAATSAVGGSNPLGKIALRRPRHPAQGAGHAQPGSSVEPLDEHEFVQLPELADPQNGQGAFGKIKLQKPRAPAAGGGHVQQGSEVEPLDRPEFVELPDLADPKGGQLAGKKIELKRPSRRDNNLQKR